VGDRVRDDGPVSRRQLTDRLATRNVEARGETETGPAGSATPYRIHVALHHDHLPRLADVGLLDYDDETVAATPELEAQSSWLDALRRRHDLSDLEHWSVRVGAYRGTDDSFDLDY